MWVVGDINGDVHPKHGYFFNSQQCKKFIDKTLDKDLPPGDNLHTPFYIGPADREGMLEGHIQAIIEEVDPSPLREGLLRTPERAAKMFRDLTTPEDVEITVFDAEGMSEMIVQTDIPFHSLCEHHMLPFIGTAAIAYIPDGTIIGLSKLLRLVRYHATGLHNQERVTRNIADTLMDAMKPKGVAVVLRARHLCMELRGVQVPGVHTSTCYLHGAFQKPEVRAEFLSLVRGK